MTEKNTILIVEDDKSYISKLTAKLSESELRSKDLLVIFATNLTSATISFEENKDSLLGIITDLNFPISKGGSVGSNGIEFIKRIRQDDPNIPIILNSSKMSFELSEAGKKIGANTCLAKDTGKVVAALVDAIKNPSRDIPSMGR